MRLARQACRLSPVVTSRPVEAVHAPYDLQREMVTVTEQGLNGRGHNSDPEAGSLCLHARMEAVSGPRVEGLR
jgi:hypothetical protein